MYISIYIYIYWKRLGPTFFPGHSGGSTAIRVVLSGSSCNNSSIVSSGGGSSCMVVDVLMLHVCGLATHRCPHMAQHAHAQPQNIA